MEQHAFSFGSSLSVLQGYSSLRGDVIILMAVTATFSRPFAKIGNISQSDVMIFKKSHIKNISLLLQEMLSKKIALMIATNNYFFSNKRTIMI